MDHDDVAMLMAMAIARGTVMMMNNGGNSNLNGDSENGEWW